MKKTDSNDKNVKKGKHNFLYFFLMTAFIFAGIYVLYMQYEYTVELNEKNAAVTADIEKQKKITEKLNTQEEYYSSDEYIEKIAREQLSLVKPNEILFVDLNK